MKLFKFLYNDKILFFTIIITCLTLFLGTPSFSSIDWHTISSLTALLISVELLKETKILNNLSIQIYNHAKNTKILSLLLGLLAFFGSMILTNDVAILIIIPMAINLYQQLKINYFLPITLIIVASNLGSSITPFGNPQNIFLISKYGLNLSNFFKMSIPIGIISLIILICFIMSIKKIKFTNESQSLYKTNYFKVSISLITLIIVLLSIFNIIPIIISLLITIAISLSINFRIFNHIDYRLIVTFILFFIAINNLTNSPLVSKLLESIIESNTPLQLTGLLFSQFISNVPTAILFSNYTDNYQALYQSVTIGGLGTIVASLANLIAIKQIIIYDQRKNISKFIIFFSIINFILIGLILLILKILTS